ncbi:MAG: hypothetical protein A2430_01465 [Candidatus Liptonbacteria bacterium RIFOXYC1_FULL_36_8]|uniref:ATP-cone domain-containing protein n=3 Tax=Candidatus Liptoniibacteriota TaxID=1817909 RepID=A0A1G2CQX2_9BACT|nr:MAG: hypothetical protein A2390_02535 [Candidatus Liptonbacteria bacterium RIFOXYB1_FULL_36_10]OGZ03943.1 MAG: hypothetical protein A2604_03235 [Candidatus Liptonbacteria bacterium RIFOXYD1_FULL_36_11]OGZ04360.1 MAG: hypothetical protein A2430_01465 [Candidatus Liptonbacteria bacterium RIFOXYC1_FULL_36_8]
MKKISIIKSNGAKDFFSPEKVANSLIRAGAGQDEAEKISQEVEKKIKNGDTTADIYRQAFFLLRRYGKPLAVRFSLKHAIMDLGPSGYPFEQLIGRILEKEGYKTSFPNVIFGKCVGHEVDVIAENSKEKIMIEAKFHNQPGFRTDVKVALYVRARFEDLIAVPKNNFSSCWLITNTKFSEDALKYARCAGVNAVGWGYPKEKGLENMIDASNLYPITAMPSLSRNEKRLLLDNNIVVCTDIKNIEKLVSIGIKKEKAEVCLKEALEITKANS